MSLKRAQKWVKTVSRYSFISFCAHGQSLSLGFVSNIGYNQSQKLSKCFPINIRGSGAYWLLPMWLFFKISMCAHISVILNAFWLLQSTPNRSRYRDRDLLRSLSCLQFLMRGWGGFCPSPITEFIRKSLHIVSFWSILGSMGYLCLYNTSKF